ncbi:hypothetical protein F4604DRAFT_1675009 [Suillus subluteus]|nr:hypothetical protein F4604DRAFT_1675009 [Suillus subluteus]
MGDDERVGKFSKVEGGGGMVLSVAFQRYQQRPKFDLILKPTNSKNGNCKCGDRSSSIRHSLREMVIARGLLPCVTIHMGQKVFNPRQNQICDSNEVTVSETDSDPEDSFPLTPDSKCLGGAYYHLTTPSKAELWTSTYWADLTVTVDQELRTARHMNGLSPTSCRYVVHYKEAVRERQYHIVQGLLARSSAGSSDNPSSCIGSSPSTTDDYTQTNAFFINGLKVSEYIDNSAPTEQERIQNEHSRSCTHCHFTHIGGLGAPTTGHTQWSHELGTQLIRSATTSTPATPAFGSLQIWHEVIDIDVMHFPKCGLNKPHCCSLRNFGTCLPSVRSSLLPCMENDIGGISKNFSSTGQPLAGDSEFYPNHDNNLENACIETVLLQPSLSQPGYYGHQHDGQAQASGSSSCQTHMLPPTNDPIYHDNNVYDPSTNPFATVAVMPMPLLWHIPSYPQVQVPPHLLGYDQPPANYYQFYGNINHSSLPAGLQMPIYSMPPSPPHPPNHDLEITFDVLYPPSNTIVRNLFELEAPTFMHPPDDQVPEMRNDIADIDPMQSHIVSVQLRYPSSSLSAFLPEFAQPVLSKDGDALLPTGAEDECLRDSIVDAFLPLDDRDKSLQEPVAGTENPEDDLTFRYYRGPSDRRGRKGKGGLKHAARLHLLFNDKNKMHQRIVRSAKRAIMKHALNVTALTEEGDRVTLAANKLKEAAQKRMGEKQGIKWASHNSGMLYMILSELCKSIMQMCRKHTDNLVLDGFSLHLSIWSGASEFAHQETLIAGLLDNQIFPPKFVMRLGTNDEVYFLENEVVLNIMLNTIRELDLCKYVEELDSLACIAAVAVCCALEKVKRRISTCEWSILKKTIDPTTDTVAVSIITYHAYPLLGAHMSILLAYWWRPIHFQVLLVLNVESLGFYYDSDDVTRLYVVRCALEKVKRRISTDVEFSGTAFKGLYKKLMDYIEGTIKKCPRLRKRWENYKKSTLFVTHPAKNVDSGTCASNYSLVDNTARLQKLLRTLRGIFSGLRKIESFKQAPAPPGGLSLILQYFNILLGKGELNHFESWRARCCNREGNANVPDKVIACFAETGQTEKIVLYSKKVGCKGAEFASQLVNDENRPLVDMERVVDIFMSQNMVQPTTSSLLNALKDNKPEQGHLWTRLLEINLIHVPQVADAIVGNEMFTNYDRPQIANLCKTAGLLQRALEHYEDLADIKRAIVHTSGLQLEEMLRINIWQNLQAVIQIATKYTDVFGPVKLIEMFGSFKTFEGGANLQREQLLQPEKVKNFLKEAKLPDQVPLILVCDHFDFVHDLVLYLYQNGLTKFIEMYIVGGLLDVGCDETTIKGLLASVTENFPIDECVNEAEQRNCLKHILPWLEARVQSGSQDPAVPNALAKIFIDSNNNLEMSLKENNLYESLVVGKFCEARDQRQFDVQAPEHWTQVLVHDNIHRRALIDQCTDPDAVSVTVKAFLSADFPIELIELLEKVVIEPFPISDNLQNLLLLTSIRTDKGKVVGYINNLQNYDAREIAKIATDHGLYEEALTIYKKYDQHAMAINVLVEHITPIDHSLDYSNKANKPDSVWSRLANAQLNGLRIKDAVDSYIKAEDPSNFAEVIEIWSHAGKHDDLVRFLQMAPKALHEPKIDTELAYAYAKTDHLHDMEAFLTMSDIADILEVGEKCFEDELYQAAKLLFTSISNWAHLATTLIYLGENQAAVESAWKAGNTQAWKQVHAACIEKAEFRLAQICVLNIVVHTGYCDEVPSLLEAALSLERAHQVQTGKLMEHLKLFVLRINIPKAGVTHTILLFQDNAASAMIECSADAWEHNQFKDVVVQATNVEMLSWSKATYTYGEAACLATLGEHAEVKKLVKRVQGLRQKITGKSIPVEPHFSLEHPYVFHVIAHAPREVIVMETIPAVGGTSEVLGLSGGSEGGTKATGAKKGKNKKLESQNYASKARSVEQTYQGPARRLSHQGCHWLAEVIEILSHAGKHDDLVCFLRMAHLNIIVYTEEVAALLWSCEHWDYFDEVLSLLEAALSLERAHTGVFAKLLILHNKYGPGKHRRIVISITLMLGDTRHIKKRSRTQGAGHRAKTKLSLMPTMKLCLRVRHGAQGYTDEEELVEGNVRCVHHDALGTAENGHQDTPTTPPARGYDRGH